MDSSRRAVESYWRSMMIDGATSDEDKVTPVYKLEEICELIRGSPAGIVKEVSKFVLKRLDHKSPVVKQKALRLIKFSVGKSGPEFRREMQRHSVAVKQLLHYKGQPDPLKGDALNKAVRETAQDALSAIFSMEDNKPATTEVTHKRMEGFGNTNFVMPSEEKSFMSELVDLGSASFKQGLSNLAQSHSFKKNDTGSYKGPILHTSLTNEVDHSNRHAKEEYHGSSQGSSSMLRNVTSGPWDQGSTMGHMESTNGDSSSSHTESKTREERFLETIVTSGGVRLQPTRDALQAFLLEASKMNALALSRALESKLQSPHWQVRVKGVCVLEAILRKKDEENFGVVASYFGDNIDVVIKCSESPQASLREKANRVLSILDGGGNAAERSSKTERTVVEMPNLIDTGDNDLLGPEDPRGSKNYVENKSSFGSPLIDDLFGDCSSTVLSTSEQRTDDDPFADVSFHSSEDKELDGDLFAGVAVRENSNTSFDVPRTDASDPFDMFGTSEPLQKQDDMLGSSEPLQKQEDYGNDVNNLMSNLSISESGPVMNPKSNSFGVLPESVLLDSNSRSGSQVLNTSLSGIGSQEATSNLNAFFPSGPIAYNVPSGMLLNEFYPSLPVNYGAMGGLMTQQHFMAAMANLHSLGNLSSLNMSSGHAVETMGANSSALPDIFNTALPAQPSASTINTLKKEDTKAFDFISDHLASARDPKG